MSGFFIYSHISVLARKEIKISNRCSVVQNNILILLAYYDTAGWQKSHNWVLNEIFMLVSGVFNKQTGAECQTHSEKPLIILFEICYSGILHGKITMLVLGKLLLFCFCLNIIDFPSVEFLSVWFLTSDGNKRRSQSNRRHSSGSILP